jgi:GNAT superfamily N-acetyltransferase
VLCCLAAARGPRRPGGEGTALDGPRGVRPGELPALLQLVDSVFRPEGGAMGAEFPTLFCESNGPWLRTFWDGERPVSHAGFWLGRIRSHGRVLDVAHLGAVCTAPGYRGRGLASALLADALPRLQERGVSLLLISGDRTLYRRLGARRFGPLWRFEVDQAAAAALAAPGLPVRVLAGPEPAALEAMRRLQGAEAVRYERAEEDWAALLPAKGYAPPAGGARAALAGDGLPSAYLLCGAPRGDAARVLPVDEFAGDRRAVLSALGPLLAAAGCERAVLLAQPGDAALAAPLRALGLEPARAWHQGTAVVLQPARCRILTEEPAPDGPGAAGEPWELPRNDGLQYI